MNPKTPTPPAGDPNWKEMALECLDALRLMGAHYDDLGKSNPGFMGKLVLQDYALWNEALMATYGTIKKFAHVKTTKITDKG